ncbi:MAG: DUF1385 domain-containing protein [Dehalococcoidaceae bacterium]|nr:DUF1385 domain-containing protein [Dehalococcoidaceae bacterium]
MADCKINYGGQAVMEGVMIRGKDTAVTAVRNPRGIIVTRCRKLSRIYTGKLRQTPFIRGIIVLIESLALGLSSLNWSANIALEEEDDKGGTKQEMSSAYTWIIMVVAFALGIGLFFILPLLLTKLLDPLVESSVVFHLIEGIIRLGIFLLYLKLISLMADIRRVFSYHGAEHKTINAYEHGEPLEPEFIQKYSTAHARCGTAFLLSVMVLAILVFSLVGKQALWLMILSRIALLPVIAALGYELTQFGARHMSNPFTRALVAPGLWLQSLTTGEPDDSQIEVAVAALREVLKAEAGEPEKTAA